jgi:hypothetical protein
VNNSASQPRDNDVGIEDEPHLAARGALLLRAIGGDLGFDLFHAEGLDAGGGDAGARFGEALQAPGAHGVGQQRPEAFGLEQARRAASVARGSGRLSLMSSVVIGCRL